MNVPFVDLYAQYLTIKKEIDSAIENVIKNSLYIGGSPVQSFEKNYAQHTGIKHVIGCANGTDSLEILLQVFNVNAGDEVIVPAMSWISTSEAVGTRGAKPVFVDIDPLTYTIDVSKIEKSITPKTKAIIPVHLYGNPADMPAIMHIAQKHNLKVIEDCAQSHDATINGKKIGTFGDAASFSFYPGKNLGAYGDAGAMATNDDDTALKARMIANHGQQGKHNHQMEGRNSRLDGLHAAVLDVKLKYIDKWTKLRMEHANTYNELFKGTSVKTPFVKDGFGHVYHLYVIQVENREKVIDQLNKNSIGNALHYPTPLPFLPAYKHLNHKPSDFPVVHEFAKRIVSIPMYAEISNDQIRFVVDTIKKVL